MLKYRAAYILIFIINICVFIVANSAVQLVFAGAMIILPLISLLRIVLFVSTLSARCSVRESAEAGQTIYIEINLKSKISIMVGEVFFVCENENKMFGDKTQTNVFTKVKRGNNKISIPFTSDSCGRVVIRLKNLQCYDIMHLFCAKAKLNFEREIAVYPRHIDCNALLSKNFSIEREGRVYDIYKKGNDTSEIINIRKYQYGDSIKNIHWKLSSKLNSLLVREFSSPNDLNILIFCDASLYQNDMPIKKEGISDSLSLTTAISLSLTEQGIGHSVCIMHSKSVTVQGIESMTMHAQMVNTMIDMTLDNEPFNSAEAFVSLGIGYGYSKIIYIANEYNSKTVNLMAQGTDLTVIVTNDGEESTFETRSVYTLASLSTNRLYSGTNNLSL